MTAKGRLFHWGKTNPFNTSAYPQRLYPTSSGNGDAGPARKNQKKKHVSAHCVSLIDVKRDTIVVGFGVVNFLFNVVARVEIVDLFI